MAKLFDKVKGVAGSESEKAVIEATLHTAREPPPEKYVRRLVLNTSSGGENAVIAAALKKRLDELDWKIVLKALIVTHTLTREGDLQFTAEMNAYSDKMRYLNRFNDLSSGVGHTQSTFVRPYSQYIGARLKTYAETRTDYERDPSRAKEMSLLVSIDKYPVFAAQLDALLGCKTESTTNTNVLIFAALQLLVRDSMRLYAVLTMIVSRLIEEFPRQSKDVMQKTLNIYKSFLSHTEGLNIFFEAVRSSIAECPSPLKMPPTSLRSLEEYMNNPQPQNYDNNPPLEKLNLGGAPLHVQHHAAPVNQGQPQYTGVFAGSSPMYPGPASQTAPQYPAAAVRQATVPQMGNNPFAAAAAPAPSQPAPYTNPYAQPTPASPASRYSSSGAAPAPGPYNNPYALPTSNSSAAYTNPYAQPTTPASPASRYGSSGGATAAAPAPAPAPVVANPYTATGAAAHNPYTASGGSPAFYSPPPAAQPQPNPFAAPGVAYSPGTAPASASQPKYPTPPTHASSPYGAPNAGSNTAYLPQGYASPSGTPASPPFSPAPNANSNPFAAVAIKPAAQPTSPPHQTSSTNLGAIAAHLQGPPASAAAPASVTPQPTQWGQPASAASPFTIGAGGSATQVGAPSANVQAQFSAASGQQQMLYYRLPTGEFVAVPASALQGMSLSAAPPAQPSNPFGQQ